MKNLLNILIFIVVIFFKVNPLNACSKWFHLNIIGKKKLKLFERELTKLAINLIR